MSDFCEICKWTECAAYDPPCEDCRDDDFGDFELAEPYASAPDMLEALEGMVKRYADLINSGDCGFWNPENDKEVIQARAAMSQVRRDSQAHGLTKQEDQ